MKTCQAFFFFKVLLVALEGCYLYVAQSKCFPLLSDRCNISIFSPPLFFDPTSHSFAGPSPQQRALVFVAV